MTIELFIPNPNSSVKKRGHQGVAYWGIGFGMTLNHKLHKTLFYFTGLETRLREVCNNLLGPVYTTKGKNSWDKTILVGKSKFKYMSCDVGSRYLHTQSAIYQESLDMYPVLLEPFLFVLRPKFRPLDSCACMIRNHTVFHSHNKSILSYGLCP